jgi:hypothetical protein
MRRLTLLAVLVAFVFSCGGQWYVLQGIAWVNMIREYSQMVPFSQAVEMTLSGQYPCSICKAIAEKQRDENAKMASLDKLEKKALSPGFAWRQPERPADIFHFAAHSQFLVTRSDAPPVPPPRCA